MSSWFDFTTEMIKRVAPVSGGVYLIRRNLTGSMVYIGKATNLEERLLAHRDGSSDQSKCILKYTPAKFAWEKISDSEKRTRRETELIKHHGPLCNG